MRMQGIHELFHPYGQEKFLLAGTDGKSFWKNSGNKAPGTCRIRPCTNFATEKVNVHASPEKSAMEKSDKNNSVTESKGRMHGSQVLRLGTSWSSNWEGHARGQSIITLLERSLENKKCTLTSKGTMQWRVKTDDWKKRLGMFGYILSC